MEKSRIDEAIIIDRRTMREYDSLVTVYTKNYGKLKLLARGTKKINSKLAGHLEPLQEIKLMMVTGRHYDYVGSAVVSNAYLKFRSNPEIYNLTGGAIFVFDRLLKESLPDVNIYTLLKDFFILLSVDSIRLDQAKLLRDLFIFKLLFFLGYRFNFRSCAVCGRGFDGKTQYFDREQANFEHGQCRKNDFRRYVKISNNIFTLLSAMEKGELFTVINSLGLSNESGSEINILVNSFLRYHFDFS